MTTICAWIFWFCLAWGVYAYIGYPLLLWQLCVWVQMRRDLRYCARRGERRVRNLTPAELPPLSMIIPVHNEERYLAEKLENLTALDYPADRLEVIFISDGSTDGSNAILERAPARYRVRYLDRSEGKARVLNRGVAAARHELLIFCDAATLLAPDALVRLARHFEDPRVGVVCGSLELRGNLEAMRTEGLYWRYERLLQVLEARLGATLTANGPLYALRRDCYLGLTPEILIEDFVIPMSARALGYRVEHDPEARAVDYTAASVEGEFSRRVRLAVGSFRALGQLLRLPLDRVTRWALISHKVCRWLLPFVMLLALVCSAALANRPIYGAALLLQIGFYGWALVGYAVRRRERRPYFAGVAYYLLAMNAAYVVGWAQLAFRHGEVKWK